MKVIRDDVVYVQNYDLAYLLKSNMEMPESVFNKIFENDDSFMVLNYNKNEFVSFSDQVAVDYFRKIDWILDYDCFIKLSEKELKRIATDAINRKKINNIIFSLQKEEYKSTNKFQSENEFLDHRRYSIKTLLAIKNGEVEIQLPEEISKK